jgi:cell division septation protein DedD
MHIDIVKAVEDLLLEKGQIVLPGLGEFSGTPQPAVIDYIKGVIAPPSQKLQFNPDIVLNDGVLVNYLQNRYEITAGHAENAINEFVTEVKDKLGKREIFILPHIGRLYSDYQNNIKFLQEETNLNPDSFGLPDVRFSSEVRVEQIAGKVTPNTVEKNSPVMTSAQASIPASESLMLSRARSNFRKWLPWVMVAAAVLLAFAIWYLLKPAPQADTEPVTQAPTSTENQTVPANTQSDSQETQQTLDASTISDNSPQPREPEEPAQVNTTKTECTIIIHSFGVARNARKFTDRLRRDGYQPDIKIEGPLRRVGILFQYTDRSEVERMKIELGRRYNAGPVVFGEEEIQ